MDRLKEKIALITGGTTGIGLASARLFRDEGATVVVTGRNAANVAAAAAEPGIDAIRCDQANLAEIDALVAQVKDRYGRLDVVFVNAGVPSSGHALGKADEATFDRIIGINLKGVLFTVQATLPLIPDGGSIVLTSSASAHSALPGASIYAASKAGVRAFARSWAAELMPRRIRVNTLTPGLIDTPLFDRFKVSRETVLARMVGIVPMGRAGEPIEAANAALFLASDEASFMTGAEIIVAGGQLDL